MNILPKKRWHVRTKQNIERVRRDEAKAAEDEKELKRRIQLAEQEARTDLLRKRARKEVVVVESEKTENREEHVNFFKDIEEAGYSGLVNKEHEEEEKARKEKFEKDIGLLTYLGQSTLEAKGEAPWYLKNNFKEQCSADKGKDETASEKYKSMIDPLNNMQKYLSVKQKREKEIFVYKKPSSCPTKDIKTDSKKLSKLEELRAKRLKREAEERKRSHHFLENLRKDPEQPEEVPDDRTRKYNSQFNPHLARNHLHRN